MRVCIPRLILADKLVPIHECIYKLKLRFVHNAVRPQATNSIREVLGWCVYQERVRVTNLAAEFWVLWSFCNVRVRKATKKAIALIKTACNKCMYKRFGRFLIKKISYTTYLVQGIWSWATNILYIIIHPKIIFKDDTKVTCTFDRLYRNISNFDRW